MPALRPQSPVRADHRFIHQMVGITVKGPVEYRASEFNRIARVFANLGGSWERLFRGSPYDVGLVKRIVKLAAKHGYLTKKEKW